VENFLDCGASALPKSSWEFLGVLLDPMANSKPGRRGLVLLPISMGDKAGRRHYWKTIEIRDARLHALETFQNALKGFEQVTVIGRVALVILLDSSKSFRYANTNSAA
jgi:hypothetical protein